MIYKDVNKGNQTYTKILTKAMTIDIQRCKQRQWYIYKDVNQRQLDIYKDVN